MAKREWLRHQSEWQRYKDADLKRLAEETRVWLQTEAGNTQSTSITDQIRASSEPSINRFAPIFAEQDPSDFAPEFRDKGMLLSHTMNMPRSVKAAHILGGLEEHRIFFGIHPSPQGYFSPYSGSFEIRQDKSKKKGLFLGVPDNFKHGMLEGDLLQETGAKAALDLLFLDDMMMANFNLETEMIYPPDAGPLWFRNRRAKMPVYLYPFPDLSGGF